MTGRPPASDPAHFRKVLGRFPTGVTIVTAMDEGRPTGLAIGSFTSVSLDPPLVAFLPTKTSASYAAIESSGAFCVNVVAEDQKAMTGVFASKAEDKFAGVDWEPAPVTGSPKLGGCLAWMDCKVHAVHDGGDHWIVVGAVQEMDVDDRDVGPLLFFTGAYGGFAALD
ncbi:MAG: flavin reductase family protein [Acidimicrobiales bacterium]|nr:flavin reductase family protein [Acidimicrobiales bacterium]